MDTIRRGHSSELPRNAQLISRDEAALFVYKDIHNHEPLREVCLLRYGGAILGALSSLSGVFMLRHFRSRMGLRKEALISSTLTAGFLPAIGSFVYHWVFITPPIVLEEVSCPLCLELKVAAIQSFSGFILPYSIGIVSASMTAVKLGANVPTLLNPVRLLQFSFELLSSNNGPKKYAALYFINVLGAIFLMYGEQIQLIQFKKRVAARRAMAE